MSRRFTFCWACISVFVSQVPLGFCQGSPRVLSAILSGGTVRAITSRPAPPITRTVQVDVPVPCAPMRCGPPMPCRHIPVLRPFVRRPADSACTGESGRSGPPGTVRPAATGSESLSGLRSLWTGSRNDRSHHVSADKIAGENVSSPWL